MKISIFNDGTFITGADYTYCPEKIQDDIVIPASGNENCINVIDIDFNPEFQTIRLSQDMDLLIEDKEIVIENHDSPMSIGRYITEQNFGGNPYAQIADIVKAQVTTIALLVPILGKEVVAGAYADLIVTVKKVSESRVKQGLSAYDLSFLD